MSRKPKFNDRMDVDDRNVSLNMDKKAIHVGTLAEDELESAEFVAAPIDQREEAAYANPIIHHANAEPERSILYYDELDTPLGMLTLVHSDNGLCHIKFRSYGEAEERLTEWANRWYGAHRLEHSPDRLADATMQLRQYFAGERQVFDLPLDMRGTDFQRRVWEELCTIPYGEAVSYKHIAEQIGSPAAVRAVGGANNRNPVSIIVPCHRVIGMNGQLVGYGGGLDNKQYLLGLEGWRGMEVEPVLF